MTRRICFNSQELLEFTIISFIFMSLMLDLEVILLVEEPSLKCLGAISFLFSYHDH